MNDGGRYYPAYRNVIHFGFLSAMNKKTLSTLIAALSCLLGLAACVGPATDTSFPKADLAMTPDGTFPNLENLRMVDLGMTKNQLYELVGPPHFHESVFHVRVWNYLFHFHTGDRTITCEYQIQFDKDSRVSQTRWKDQECEEFAPAKAASGANAASPEPAQATPVQ
ncbi:outer membrane protein assembly factor BamE (lipoprotein component of BamABCDE complex) [Trinickia symbiotica]|nr:outer membrane protein assembly factor BamE (lipoprotein component of BamABCDE complex) [Trinickia symbiotica]